MTTKTELDNLLAAYERANNRGSVKEAGRVLPQIIRAIVDFVENPGVPYVDKTLWTKEEVRELAESVFAPPPCAPCDPTNEAPNGVAEDPFLTTIKALEAAQDAQALGVEVEDLTAALESAKETITIETGGDPTAADLEAVRAEFEAAKLAAAEEAMIAEKLAAATERDKFVVDETGDEKAEEKPAELPDEAPAGDAAAKPKGKAKATPPQVPN
jgi:hypothetical protein